MLISSEINLLGGLRVQTCQILIAFTINILIAVTTYFALRARDVLVLLSRLAWSEFRRHRQEENVTRSPLPAMEKLLRGLCRYWNILLAPSSCEEINRFKAQTILRLWCWFSIHFSRRPALCSGQVTLRVTSDPPQIHQFVSFQTPPSRCRNSARRWWRVKLWRFW